MLCGGVYIKREFIISRQVYIWYYYISLHNLSVSKILCLTDVVQVSEEYLKHWECLDRSGSQNGLRGKMVIILDKLGMA